MDTVFIYALCEPDTGEIRYVGKAKNLKDRLSQHISAARLSDESNHKSRWIRSLIRRGLKPTIQPLDEVLPEVWPQWEVAWIEFYQEQGFDLVNATPGGEATFPENGGEKHPCWGKTGSLSHNFGRKRSDEFKENLRRLNSGSNHPQFGKTKSEETRAKISLGRKGKAAWNKGISTGQIPWNKGKKATPEACAKQSASHKGVKLSAEHCAAVSAGQLGKKRGPYKKKEVF